MTSVLLTVALTYAFIVGVAYLFQRQLIYFPDSARGNPRAAGVPEMHEVELPTDDALDIAAWYKAPDPGRPTVVFFHGNAGSLTTTATYKARPFLDAGLGLLLVEYRGYGGNPGSPSEQGLYSDARAAVKWLHDHEGIGPERLVYYGESLGSGVAVHLAVEFPPAAVVLEAPYTSIVDVGRRAYWYLPVGTLLKDRYETATRIARVRAPVLVVHGERDRTVPPAMGREVLRLANPPKDGVFIDTAGHNDLFSHGAAQKVLAWISKTVK